jgi:hypothetical protein
MNCGANRAARHTLHCLPPQAPVARGTGLYHGMKDSVGDSKLSEGKECS